MALMNDNKGHCSILMCRCCCDLSLLTFLLLDDRNQSFYTVPESNQQTVSESLHLFTNMLFECSSVGELIAFLNI